MTRRFSTEYKLESAQLVVDQNYTVAEAARAVNVGVSTINKWAKQLRDERKGSCDQPNAITPEQRKIKELEKHIKRIELEKEILKKATALLT